MVTIQDIKTKLLNANALGRTNLAEKGVEIPESATTYEIMNAIAEVSGGGGIEYTSVDYNEDDTITLTDTNGTTHTMVCVYENDVLVSVSYDDKAIDLVYDGDELKSIGKTAINMANVKTTGLAPIDHTVTFLADNEPYEIVSVKNGNSVNAPLTDPTSENGTLTGWQIDGNTVDFPYLPTSDVDITALFQSVRTEMEISLAVQLWYKGSSGSAFDASTKTNTDTAIVASVSSYNGRYTKRMGVLVGLTEQSVEIECLNNGYTIRTVEYEGTTYHFNCCNTQCSYFNKDITILNVGTFNSNSDYSYTDEQLTEIATTVLDYYFKKI